jgi:hypothetical protein
MAQKCAERGLNDTDKFIKTMKSYNDAVYVYQKENPDKKWDPAVKDGLFTQSASIKLPLAKSNWALPL